MAFKMDCIGCQACVDLCPQNAIEFSYDEWGEGVANVDRGVCNDCGLCEHICPSKKIQFNAAQTTVYAAVSKRNRSFGSSGGIFYEIASQFISEGGIVFGAAFDKNLKLVHKGATSVSELMSLCKSKYLHSDMDGVYSQICGCLKEGKHVMFVGTPCQVSAVKNRFFEKFRAQLLLVDFLCHGTGTQKIFDMCIDAEEKKRKGKILDFCFRAKSRRAEHSFKYTLQRGAQIKTVSGYHFEFPYYHSYLKYNIFNDYCYDCKYACAERVGDITLGDFWKIQNYSNRLKDYKGVSMLSINTSKGREVFERVKAQCTIEEHPIQNASKGNQSFKEPVSMQKRDEKHRYLRVLLEKGDSALVNSLSCSNVRKNRLYAITPTFIKKAWSYMKGRI